MLRPCCFLSFPLPTFSAFWPLAWREGYRNLAVNIFVWKKTTHSSWWTRSTLAIAWFKLSTNGQKILVRVSWYDTSSCSCLLVWSIMKNISYNLIDLRPSFSCSQHRSDFKVSASLSGGPIVYRRLPPHFRCLARRMAENYARQSVVWLPKMGGAQWAPRGK